MGNLSEAVETFTFALNELQHSALAGNSLLSVQEQWKKTQDRVSLILHRRLVAQAQTLEQLSLQEAVNMACSLMEEMSKLKSEVSKLDELHHEANKQLHLVEFEHLKQMEEKQKQISRLTEQLERQLAVAGSIPGSPSPKSQPNSVTVANIESATQGGNGHNATSTSQLHPQEVITSIRKDKGIDMEVRMPL
jgi:hypothetical protein